MDMFAWIALAAAIVLLGCIVLGAVWLARRPPRMAPLPTDWALSARPVFTADERRVHKLLRDALPHHIVLSKLPLVRFSQPADPSQVRFWYDLLGAINVTFAVCSANGRVLAAIDLDTDRGNSRRILQIKQSVLGACRIRYLRCPVDNLPSAAELQLLVPGSASATARGPQPPMPSNDLDEARDSLASTVASRRAQRSALWQDSSVFQDSFFAPDSRHDSLGNSEFAGLPASSTAVPSTTAKGNGHGNGNGRRHDNGAAYGDRLDPGRMFRHRDGGDDVGAVVVDTPTQPASRSHH